MSQSAPGVGCVIAVVAAVLVGVAPGAVASSHGGSVRAGSAATAGAVYGGVTSQGWPVVLELRKNRRQVVKATIGIRLPCTSGTFVTVPDTYTRVSVSKKRRFSVSFGPETERNDDGTTFDAEGSFSGALNSARTTISGKWQLKFTDHDATGAVTDTCDSGLVTWTAKR